MTSALPPLGNINRAIRVAYVLLFLVQVVTARATTYYVDSQNGDDAFSGQSVAQPWRTLMKAGRASLHPGDTLALAAGQRHEGQLQLGRLVGSAEAPIVVTSYPQTTKTPALIDGRGYSAAISLLNCSYVKLVNLSATADGGGWKNGVPKKNPMRCGVLVEAVTQVCDGIELSQVEVKNVSFAEPGTARPEKDVHTPNGTTPYGWGVRFIARGEGSGLRGISVRDCRIERVDHTGLKFTAPNDGIRDVKVERVHITDVGGPGVQMSGVVGGHFTHMEIDRSGSTGDSRNWGRGSGLWTWGSRDVTIEHSRFTNANGPGDSAGVHIDYNCSNVIVQYNLSANNAGGFCEILGNNRNCAYRYNISVNDGSRIKGRDGAFQEGKTFWLSGYVGSGKKVGPFNSYFYNNTIYVREGLEAKFAVAPTAQGVLVANNIFCLIGPSKVVAGDQSKADAHSEAVIERALVSHNLLLRADNWPTGLGLENREAIIGDPSFRNAGGYELADYLPRATALVRDRGMEISALLGDPIGLAIGLHPATDILGQPVIGLPDLGAIELPQ